MHMGSYKRFQANELQQLEPRDKWGQSLTFALANRLN